MVTGAVRKRECCPLCSLSCPLSCSFVVLFAELFVLDNNWIAFFFAFCPAPYLRNPTTPVIFTHLNPTSGRYTHTQSQKERERERERRHEEANSAVVFYSRLQGKQPCVFGRNEPFLIHIFRATMERFLDSPK